MPGAERDDDSGQYTETYPREDFLDAVGDPGDMTGTQDVADAVGCSYESAYKKLRALDDEGAVESRKVANTRVWFIDGDTQRPSDRRESAETRSQEQADESVAEGATTSTADEGDDASGDDDGSDGSAFDELIGDK